LFPSKLKLILSFKVFEPMAIAWNLSGFAFRHFCGETNTRKIDKIQERALRFIYEDYSSSYEDLLNKSRLPTLKIRRLRTPIRFNTFNCLEAFLHIHMYLRYEC
jgi:hypothetical protein